MCALRLSPADASTLAGNEGDAARFAMRVVVRMAEIAGAPRLLDVASAHVGSCLYHGQAGLDFAERLVAGGARVSVPTTLNVSSLDLLHPDLYRGERQTARSARRLMDLHVEMGCRPTWTCAPYQLPQRPSRGQDVAWGESNAIVFANSVLGARTERYGDFMDVCAAITGRVPDAGLHRPENRRASIVFDVRGVARRLMDEDAFYAALGHVIGRESGELVPAITGLDPELATEDRLKALGAAAASSGAVALFHAVGITPEAATLRDASQGRPPALARTICPSEIATARDELTTASGDRLDAVSVGTPHCSLPELHALARLFEDGAAASSVTFYASTGRDVLAAADEDGTRAALEGAGVRIVTDTCTYITPILDPRARVVMTNSAKWAYYAPGNLGVDVVFGTTSECVRSAIAGRVVRDEGSWRGRA